MDSQKTYKPGYPRWKKYENDEQRQKARAESLRKANKKYYDKLMYEARQFRMLHTENKLN